MKTLLLLFALLGAFSTYCSSSLDLKKIQPGHLFRTPEGKKYRVIKYLDKGKRGFVYLIKDDRGQTLVLKIARNQRKDTLESIQEEPEKIEDLKKLGLPHAKVYEFGKNYLIKQYIAGERVDHWFKNWVKQGADPKDKKFQKLIDLYKRSAKQGAYVNDLNHKNMIWNKKEWVIIDSSDTQWGLRRQVALKRYFEHMSGNFTKDIPCPDLYQILQAEE